MLTQLFLSYNVMLELDWIEKEHCTRKWDSVLVSVKDKRVSLALMEFSDGVNSSNSNAKEQEYITNLYSNMKEVLQRFLETAKKQAFAVRPAETLAELFQ